jgi:hypothetical protein
LTQFTNFAQEPASRTADVVASIPVLTAQMISFDGLPTVMTSLGSVLKRSCVVAQKEILNH